MTTLLPWEDSTMVSAGLDLVCRARDDHPDDLRKLLAKIPPADLADLAIVLAAMVDADEPLSVIRRWDRPDFLGPRPQVQSTCKNGHVVAGENAIANGHTPNGRRRYRCRKCLHEQRGSAAA